MQYSLPGIATIGIIIVVGLIASMVLSKDKSTRYASLLAFIVLALVAALFVVFVINEGRLELLPLFIVTSVLAPIAAYFLGIALAKHGPKGSKMVVPRATASSQPVSGATSGDPIIPQNAAMQSSTPEAPLMVQEEVVAQAAVTAEVVKEQAPVQPIAAEKRQPAPEKEAGITEATTPLQPEAVVQDAKKEPIQKQDQQEDASKQRPVRKRQYHIPSIEDISRIHPPVEDVAEEAVQQLEDKAQPERKLEAMPEAQAQMAAAESEVKSKLAQKPEVKSEPASVVEQKTEVKPVQEQKPADDQPLESKATPKQVTKQPKAEQQQRPEEQPAIKQKKALQTRPVQEATQEQKPAEAKPAEKKKSHAELCLEKAQSLGKKGQHAVAACLFEEVANQGSGSGAMRKEARYGAMISYAKAGQIEKARPFAQALKTSSRALSPVEQAKIEAILKG